MVISNSDNPTYTHYSTTISSYSLLYMKCIYSNANQIFTLIIRKDDALISSDQKLSFTASPQLGIIRGYSDDKIKPIDSYSGVTVYIYGISF